jgi:hypothetical protein
VERVLHASEETALNPEPFDLVEGVIPLQSRILEASLHVAERNHPAKAVMEDCQAAAAGISGRFQCQGSSSSSREAG